MKTATISELKCGLSDTDSNQLIDMCIRLAKFKKENKEFLTYLLYESFDEEAYIRSVKDEMQGMFEEINMSSVYFIKKSLRKILRTSGKYIRFSGSVDVEIQLLIFFCENVLAFNIPVSTTLVINNMYQNQLKKINKAVLALHEDLQYDYLKQVRPLILEK